MHITTEHPADAPSAPHLYLLVGGGERGRRVAADLVAAGGALLQQRPVDVLPQVVGALEQSVVCRRRAARSLLTGQRDCEGRIHTGPFPVSL